MKSTRIAQIVLIAGFLFLLPKANAQQSGQASGNSTGPATTGTTPARSEPRLPTMLPSPETRLPDLQTVAETIFITGSVVQEDGIAPPFGTVIELDCGDTITREAIVDYQGHYGFQVGSANRFGRVMPDASDRMGQDPFDTGSGIRGPSSFGSMSASARTPLSIRLMRCEVRAQYPGYKSSSVRMDAGQRTGYTEVGTIVIYPLEKVRGTSVSATSLLAPKPARKDMERAAKALKKSQYNDAEELLKSSIEIYPKNAEAWYLLGEAYSMQKRKEEAQESYKKSIDVDSFFVRPYIPLARMAMAEQNWKIAADLTDKALELDPVSFPEAYFANALSHYQLGEMDAAERSVLKGQRMDFAKQYPKLHLILSNILLRKKDEPGSLEEMRQYLKAAPNAEDAPVVRARIQEREKSLKAAIK